MKPVIYPERERLLHSDAVQSKDCQLPLSVQCTAYRLPPSGCAPDRHLLSRNLRQRSVPSDPHRSRATPACIHRPHAYAAAHWLPVKIETDATTPVARGHPQRHNLKPSARFDARRAHRPTAAGSDRDVHPPHEEAALQRTRRDQLLAGETSGADACSCAVSAPMSIHRLISSARQHLSPKQARDRFHIARRFEYADPPPLPAADARHPPRTRR